MIDRLKYAITDYFDSWKGRWTLAIGCLLLGFAVPSHRWLIDNLVPPIALRWIGSSTPRGQSSSLRENVQSLPEHPPTTASQRPASPFPRHDQLLVTPDTRSQDAR